MIDILYKQLRNMPVYKSKRFIKWVHETKGKEGLQFHHLTGSMGRMHLNNYLGVLVSAEEHQEAHKGASEFCIERLPEAINNLCEYVEFLESKS